MNETRKREVEDESTALQGSSKRINITPQVNREYTTVVVKNLPVNYNYHKVRRYFKACGEILQVDVIDSQDKQSKIARIEFRSYSDTLSALSRTSKKIGSAEIVVEPLINSTVWLTNFPPGFDSNKVRCLILERVNLPILSVRLPSLAFNARRRFAYIDFLSPEAAAEAVEKLNDNILESYRLVAKISNPNEKTKRTDEAISEGREIFLKNLDPSVTDKVLLDVFSECGGIEKVRVPSSKQPGMNNEDKYGFITFKTKESVEHALKLNNKIVNGKQIKVSKANRKAYLDRQEVKRILSSKGTNDRILGIFPFSDHTTPEEILKFITSHSPLNENDVQKILLVSDHEGALVIFTDTKCSATASLSLEGTLYQRKRIRCVTAKGLSRHNPNSHIAHYLINNEANSQVIEKPSTNSKMNNDDFRKLLLNKK